MSESYTCKSCGAVYDDPKVIAVCSQCQGVNTIKIRTADLPAYVVAAAQLHASVDADDFDSFVQAREQTIQMELDLSQREPLILKPPSSH